MEPLRVNPSPPLPFLRLRYSMPRPYYPLGFLDGIGRKIAAVSKVSELQPIYSLRRQQYILSLEPLRHAFEPSYFKPLLSPKLQVFYRKLQVVPSVINLSSLSYYKPQDSYLEASQGLFSSSFFCSQTRAVSSGSHGSNSFLSEHTATDGSA